MCDYEDSNETFTYQISLPPVAWKSHQGYGRKAFNPLYREKKVAQWELKIQHSQRPLIERAICIDFLFEMPIPASLPKKLQKLIDSGIKVYHDKRPDATNLRKFSEDCLIGTVLSDDSVVVTGITEKFYSRTPKTTFIIKPIGNICLLKKEKAEK